MNKTKIFLLPDKSPYHIFSPHSFNTSNQPVDKLIPKFTPKTFLDTNNDVTKCFNTPCKAYLFKTKSPYNNSFDSINYSVFSPNNFDTLVNKSASSIFSDFKGNFGKHITFCKKDRSKEFFVRKEENDPLQLLSEFNAFKARNNSNIVKTLGIKILFKPFYSHDSKQSKIPNLLAMNRSKRVNWTNAILSAKNLAQSFIYTEYCGINLETFLVLSPQKRSKYFCPSEKVNINKVIVSQLCDAVKFCHAKGIIHLDIKPANIFLKKLVVKLGDFGSSLLISALEEPKIYTSVTWQYAAPEILTGPCLPTLGCDIYSLAITIWQLETCNQPYFGLPKHPTIYAIIKKGTRPDSSKINNTALALILCRMWNPEVNQRPNIDHLKIELDNL